MTEHPLQLIRGPASSTRCETEASPRELDSSIFSKHLVVFRPDESGLDGLVDRARAAIPGLTDNAIVRKVWHHNRDSIWAIARKRKYNPQTRLGTGSSRSCS
jgi:hypothetical protein